MGWSLGVRALVGTSALLLLSALPLAGASAAVGPASAPPRCGTEGTGSGPPRNKIKVATFNVLHGLEESPLYPAHSTLDERLDMQAEQLADASVDLVGMQEVSEVLDKDPPRHHADGNVAQRLAAALSGETGFAWHWCWYLANPHFPGEPDLSAGGGGPLSDLLATLASGRYDSFKEGSAIISRFPIVATEARRLPGRLPAEAALCPPESFLEFPPECPGAVFVESRVALWAKISTPGGATQMTTTHLSHDLTDASDASALVQAAAALAFAEEKALADPPARRFFTCDCNSQPGDTVPIVPVIEAAGWTNTFTAPCNAAGDPGCTAGPDQIVTATAARPFMNERLDYVFAKAPACELGPSNLMIDTPRLRPDGSYLWPSDHIGVRVNVDPAC